jgi:hypothetical protein
MLEDEVDNTAAMVDDDKPNFRNLAAIALDNAGGSIPRPGCKPCRTYQEPMSLPPRRWGLPSSMQTMTRLCTRQPLTYWMLGWRRPRALQLFFWARITSLLPHPFLMSLSRRVIIQHNFAGVQLDITIQPVCTLDNLPSAWGGASSR